MNTALSYLALTSVFLNDVSILIVSGKRRFTVDLWSSLNCVSTSRSSENSYENLFLQEVTVCEIFIIFVLQKERLFDTACVLYKAVLGTSKFQ